MGMVSFHPHFHYYPLQLTGWEITFVNIYFRVRPVMSHANSHGSWSPSKVCLVIFVSANGKFATWRADIFVLE
jgi:hypothetical protein